MDYRRVMLSGIVGAGIIGLFGFLGYKVIAEKRNDSIRRNDFQYSFDKFGSQLLKENCDDARIILADVDGDGDSDVVLIAKYNLGGQMLQIIENKMPQKGGLEKKLDK